MSKVALVTGGNGGIGTEICKYLVKQGRTVVTTILAFEEEGIGEWQAALKEEGYDVDYVVADVSNYENTGNAIKAVEEKHGPVEILVNCAGITMDAFLHKMPQENWEKVLRINLDSVYNTTSQVIEGMRERGFGRIVNLSSVNGQTGQFGQANYSAAKAGMHGFSMAIAKEGARKNISCNTVSPGYIDTVMTQKIKEEVRQAIVATIPAGRMGAPSDIARTIAFLTEDDAGYINGANIPVNGALFTSF